jgi:hypothetical protein
VKVEYFIPGCPPPVDLILKAVNAFATGTLPPVGSIIASDKALCEECERLKEDKKITKIFRSHQIIPDPKKCLLEQGFPTGQVRVQSRPSGVSDPDPLRPREGLKAFIIANRQVDAPRPHRAPWAETESLDDWRSGRRKTARCERGFDDTPQSWAGSALAEGAEAAPIIATELPRTPQAMSHMDTPSVIPSLALGLPKAHGTYARKVLGFPFSPVPHKPATMTVLPRLVPVSQEREDYRVSH